MYYSFRCVANNRTAKLQFASAFFQDTQNGLHSREYCSLQDGFETGCWFLCLDAAANNAAADWRQTAH
jgi:hypothetical protein